MNSACACVCACLCSCVRLNEGRKNEAKVLILFVLLVPPPLEKICWFLFKSAQKKKISPNALSLRLSFEINFFDFQMHDRRVFVIKFTHATL